MGRSEFANTCEEQHAIWYGLTDGLALTLDPRHPFSLECYLEPHYYRLGVAVARIATIVCMFALGAFVASI